MNVICRVELPGRPTREQYDEFHAAMQEIGLVRTITRNGKVYHLPTGEYLGVNLTTTLDLLDLQIMVAALQATFGPCKVTITPVADPDQIYISGLEEDHSYEGALRYLGELLGRSTAPKHAGVVPVPAFTSFWESMWKA